jgi:ankyrin repeat protein
MKKLKISSLLLGTFLVPVVSYGSADFSGTGAQFAGVVVSDAALFEAIKAQNINLVKYLLDHGANVNAQGKKMEKWISDLRTYHFTPLVLAIQSQNSDMVCLLLDRGADINGFIEEVEYDYGGSFTHYLSPLVVAIRTRDIDMVRLLLERGANVNTEGGNVNVPLYEAVISGCGDIRCLLLEQKGIDVNVPQNVGISYDEYESVGYGGGDYHYQVPETALGNINKVGIGNGSKANESRAFVRLLREKGAR